MAKKKAAPPATTESIREQRHRLNIKSFLVEPGSKFRLADQDPAFTDGFAGKKEARGALLDDVTNLAHAQELLWASQTHSLLIILQAIDAAGKDGTIKHVMSGVNPQGVDVYSFKAPTDEEKKHHFLWRALKVTPARGRIAIFNRSYYEEVLVVRVHPEFLQGQALPASVSGRPLKDLWKKRYDEINEAERLLVDNNVCVLKFFLNLSRDEQRLRFIERLEDPEKNWKFSAADLKERARWDDYQAAFDDMLNATSTEHAPWYVIPADRKWFSRAAVADIITRNIERLNLNMPVLSREQVAELGVYRAQLESERVPGTDPVL